MAVFFDCAVPKGLELEFPRSVMQGIWSEARDVGHLPDLLFLAERVGIGEAEVRAAVEDSRWLELAKANRRSPHRHGALGCAFGSNRFVFHLGPGPDFGARGEITRFSQAT